MPFRIIKKVPNTPLPGIDHNRTDVYCTISNAAPREYGPEEGWRPARSERQYKRYKRRQERSRRGYTSSRSLYRPEQEEEEYEGESEGPTLMIQEIA